MYTAGGVHSRVIRLQIYPFFLKNTIIDVTILFYST